MQPRATERSDTLAGPTVATDAPPPDCCPAARPWHDGHAATSAPAGWHGVQTLARPVPPYTTPSPPARHDRKRHDWRPSWRGKRSQPGPQAMSQTRPITLRRPRWRWAKPRVPDLSWNWMGMGPYVPEGYTTGINPGVNPDLAAPTARSTASRTTTLRATVGPKFTTAARHGRGSWRRRVRPAATPGDHAPQVTAPVLVRLAPDQALPPRITRPWPMRPTIFCHRTPGIGPRCRAARLSLLETPVSAPASSIPSPTTRATSCPAPRQRFCHPLARAAWAPRCAGTGCSRRDGAGSITKAHRLPRERLVVRLERLADRAIDTSCGRPRTNWTLLGQ